MQVYMPASSTFDIIDRNHDGVITRSEFTHAAMMPTTTYAGAAPGAVVQQAVTMQPQRVIYSAPQQPIIYEQAAAPAMFTGQPQVTYSAVQPARVAYEQAAHAPGVVTYAGAPAAQVTYQQASTVSYVAPAASQVIGEQSVPTLTHAASPSIQVTDEETSSAVFEAAPAAQVMCEQAAPAFTYAGAPAHVPVPTLISYPANAAPQPTAQVTYMSAPVTAVEQPVMQHSASSVQIGTEQSVPAAGSASMVAAQPSMIESAALAGTPPTMLTYFSPMVQPQAAYYQVGGMQTTAVQPQVSYGTIAPGMQTAMLEQQTVAQPYMAMTLPHVQQVAGSEQMIATPAGATMEQIVAVPQQTEAVAVPVMEQPAVVNGKKTKKKKLTYNKKSKGCC